MASDPPAIPEWHRCHDYARLVRRWRQAARRRRLTMQAYGELDGEAAYVLETRSPAKDVPWIYLSAGIHGDEAAGTEGLIRWIEGTTRDFSRFNLLIFPCLNPWGLVNNSRTDRRGIDLNRAYHDRQVPATRAHLDLLTDRRFQLAMTLHEDYDAAGVYLYEVQVKRPFWGESLLETASRFLPIETRRTVEGRTCRNGIIRRRVKPETMPERPEALHLAFEHSDRVFTLETPSELDLRHRTAAQAAVIEAAVGYCLAENPPDAGLIPDAKQE